MENTTHITKFAPLGLRQDYTDTEGYAVGTWTIRGGYPRLTIYTDNLTRTSSYDTIIIVALDIMNVNLLLSEFERILAGPNGKKFSIECFNTRYVNNVSTNDTYLQATVTVGKDDNGIAYIGARADKRKTVKFDLLPDSKWHVYLDENDKKITDVSKLSILRATTYIKVFRNLLASKGISKIAEDINIPKKTPNSGPGSSYKGESKNTTPPHNPEGITEDMLF